MAVKCKECGKEFKNNKSGQLTKHIIKEHYDLETYYNKFYIKNKNEKYCNRDGCDNKCTFKGYKKGYTKFCSRKCIHLTRKIKRKTIKCKNCGKEIKVKINSNRKYCSTKCANEIINNDPESIKKKQKNMKKTMLEKYGVENISQTKQ